MLTQAGLADVIMAPAADMFELGVEIQVLQRGTMFGTRAKKLYEIYKILIPYRAFLRQNSKF